MLAISHNHAASETCCLKQAKQSLLVLTSNEYKDYISKNLTCFELDWYIFFFLAGAVICHWPTCTFSVRSQSRSFVFSACVHTYGRQYGHWWVLKLDVFWESISSQSPVTSTHTHSCYTELFLPPGLISPSKWLTTLSKSHSKQVYSLPSLPLQSIGFALLLNPLRMCFGQLWNLCLLHICRQLQSTPNPTSPKHPRLLYQEFQRPSQYEWLNPGSIGEQVCNQVLRHTAKSKSHAFYSKDKPGDKTWHLFRL